MIFTYNLIKNEGRNFKGLITNPTDTETIGMDTVYYDLCNSVTNDLVFEETIKETFYTGDYCFSEQTSNYGDGFPVVKINDITYSFNSMFIIDTYSRILVVKVYPLNVDVDVNDSTDIVEPVYYKVCY